MLANTSVVPFSHPAQSAHCDADCDPDAPVRQPLTFAAVAETLTGKVQAHEPIVETLPCGWALLDETVGGLVRGEFVGLIGGPGAGKSTLADLLVVAVLRQNPEARAIIFALETAPIVRVARILARECVELSENNGLLHAAPLGAMLRGELRDHATERLTAQSEALAATIGERLVFVDDCHHSGGIADRISAERPDVVEVDHLGLVQTEGGGDSDVSRLDGALLDISLALRRVNAAGLILNEVNKSSLVTKGTGLSASRGSARFASLAAAYIGISQETASPDARTEDPVVTAGLWKNRFGPAHRKQSARFFGGLAFFSWGLVTQIEAESKGGKDG